MRRLTVRAGASRSGRARSARDPRLWLGLALIAGSAGVGHVLVRGVAHRDVAYVMSHAVAAGTTLTRQDVREVSVAVPPEAVLATSAQIEGAVAARDLVAGELLQPAAVSGYVAATARIVSIPIRAGRLPAVERGSLVEVWVTPSMQGMELPGPARVVVARAVILAVPESVDSTSDTAITLQVDAMDVAALVTALRDGSVDIAVMPSEAL